MSSPSQSESEWPEARFEAMAESLRPVSVGKLLEERVQDLQQRRKKWLTESDVDEILQDLPWRLEKLPNHITNHREVRRLRRPLDKPKLRFRLEHLHIDHHFRLGREDDDMVVLIKWPPHIEYFERLKKTEYYLGRVGAVNSKKRITVTE